jgi:XTP/dITP diphosphohydrolase
VIAGTVTGTRRILLATRSRHKLAELRDLLALASSELLSVDELGLSGDAVEDGSTFEANALIKAAWGLAAGGLPTLADDSGIEVEALGWGPGVRTRRYAGDDATDAQNNAKLLAALEGLAPEQRAARYVCVLAFLERAGAEPFVFRGTFEGRIATAPRGGGGFGYDPIFEPLSERAGGRTVGQLSAAEKNAVSHRAVAARAMGTALRALGY